MKFDKTILQDLERTEFDKTYHFNGAIVHVVAPKGVTEERKNSILAEVKKINIEIIRGLSAEVAI